MPTSETHENGADVASGMPSANVPNAPQETMASGDANDAAASKPGRGDWELTRQRGGRKGKRNGAGGGPTGEERKRKDREDRPHFPTKRRRPMGGSGNDESADGAGGAPSYMNIQFSAEEIAAEEKRPKRKVAVLMGYAGTGYKGMQINHQEKTIEGDLFRAFVEAGAISKANASDPRKVSLMRCARTDKGVHAASNVVSLKVILDEPEAEAADKTAEATVEEGEGARPNGAEAVVGDKTVETGKAGEGDKTVGITAEEALTARINKHLPDQIRIWGIIRTNNAFSSHQACDSRWYEYLMPSHVLLPPHPDSFLGKKIVAAVKEKGEFDDWKTRLGETFDFWEKVEENEIKPILTRLDDATRDEVLRRLHVVDDLQQPDQLGTEDVEPEDSTADASNKPSATKAPEAVEASAPEAAAPSNTDSETMLDAPPDQDGNVAPAPAVEADPADAAIAAESWYTASEAELAVREIKAAYIAAKKRYRVSEARLDHLQAALDCYVGTNNFHNYTILKKYSDSSAKRHIKSFTVNRQPIQIDDTQWLSLKVHGQSFMMHQIRKMVAMAVLLVRSGAPPANRIKTSYGPKRISIPKAPGLGLLLERPVFDNYSKRAVQTLDRPPLNFDKFEAEIQAFKDEQIYKRMWDVEERSNVFHTFFNQLDSFATDYFLWVTANGFEGAYERKEKGDRVPKGLEAQLGDEGENPDEGEG
ncbi:tRNA pseudouridine synthase 1 [Magnaporthiopsis poae ATCC 64411]|uniref:tRNA pseudouridine synthase 1 n=1 Tax=Magnaporthiopsis poae (strain ATCC 64411 / 73-15) TaxID=644358 RepID=A0A0C4E9E4_MAGP6|nr:tRNA pseudouridine synthase 1 [Magnaporthiopsis poae ATCC 64411]